MEFNVIIENDMKILRACLLSKHDIKCYCYSEKLKILCWAQEYEKSLPAFHLVNSFPIK